MIFLTILSHLNRMPTKLPRCFFTINIDGMPLGTVIFELCADICPKTCENFMCLCTGKSLSNNQNFAAQPGSKAVLKRQKRLEIWRFW